MSSWKEKLASKTVTATTPSPQTHPSTTGGWKQRITEKQCTPQTDQPKPVIPKVSIDDLNDFPALGGTQPQQKKSSTLTGFASLAREWNQHDKEDKEREEKERAFTQQQEHAYMSKLSAINTRLMEFNYNQIKYNDEYNADYDRDLKNQWDLRDSETY